jgi:hypothetical protein
VAQRHSYVYCVQLGRYSPRAQTAQSNHLQTPRKKLADILAHLLISMSMVAIWRAIYRQHWFDKHLVALRFCALVLVQ